MARKSNRALKLFWSALDKSQSLSSDRLSLHSLISSMLEDGETVDSFISDIRNQNRTIKGALSILKESSKLEKELKRLEYVSVRPTGRVLPALPSDEAWARYMKGRTPFNAENVRGTTEHVGRPIVRISKADYSGIYDKYAGKIKQGSDYYDMLRNEDIWPIVTSETAERIRKVDRYNAFKEKLANRKRMMGDYPTSVSNVGKASKEERDRFLHERDLLAVRMAKAIIGRSASGIGEVKGTFYNEPISWRQQLGLEDTGVSSDFDYLREQEKDQKDRRKRAERFWNRKHDEASIRRFRANESFKFAMLDKDEQFIQGAMRDKGWSRDQAEQVYFKNLTENTKWLRFIAKDNPKIAKNLIPIAKAVGKAGGLPFIGGFATNPALAAVGAAMFVSSEYSKAIKKSLNWVNLISAGGGISGDALSAAAGGGLDYASALKLVQGSKRTAAKWKFGEGLDGIFRSTMYGADVSVFNPFATGEDRLRMIYNATKNIQDDGDRLAALEMWGASEEEYNHGRRLETPREQWSIEERISDRAKQWKDWREWAKVHGTTWDKINAYTSPDWWIDFWSAREEIGEDKRKELMSNLPFANIWDEVHDTAEIDDRYRAGMYDNSTTNNGGDKSITVIQHINAEVKDSDPVGFVKEMTLLGGRGKHEAESVLQNNDSLRTN